MKHALHTLWLCLALLTAGAAMPCGTASAQAITTLDWSVMRIDTILPHYSETVPLASDYGRYSFGVQIRYATWQRLTAKEERMARLNIDQIVDSLMVSTHVGTARGEGVLDIDFIPIIYNKEKDELHKLVQCQIVINAYPRNQSAPTASPNSKTQILKYSNTQQLISSKTQILKNSNTQILKNSKTQKLSDSKTQNPTSILSQGRWVKVSVAENGIHALHPTLLSQMGFNDPSRVKLYGYGGHRLSEVMRIDEYYDDLEEIPLYHDGHGNLLFWANGVTTWNWNIKQADAQHHIPNPYSTLGYYFVTEGDAPATLQTEEPWTGEATDITSFTEWVVRDIDEYSWFTGGRRLWEDKDLGVSGGRSFSIRTPGYVGKDEKAVLRISLSCGAGASTIKATWDDTHLRDTTTKKLAAYEYASNTTAEYKVVPHASGTTTLRLTTSASPARLDYIEVTYPRSFAMNTSDLSFHLNYNGAVRIRLTDRPADHKVVLMRIGTKGRPATLIAPVAEDDYVIPDANGDFVFIMNDAAFQQANIVGAIANQNLHADEPVDMVIITPASGILDSEAQRLADAHRDIDNLSCRVVRADKIYNEFSSGTPDATAYRLYMKMLWDKAKEQGLEPPRYLLLMGDGAWDNRMLTSHWRNESPDNFLLCFESENSTSDIYCYVMDDYFALMDEGEGAQLNSDKMDIGVGRMPARNASEAAAMVNKTIAHMQGQSKGLWNNLTLVLGDDGDNNSHLVYADTLANRLLRQYPEVDTRKLMWDSFRRVTTTTGNSYPELAQLITKYVESGVNMVNYTGHGGTYLLSHENVIGLADVAAYRNQNCGLWFTAACDVMPFDGRADNIGETMALSQWGSAAFIGTTRTVYAYNNSALNNAFCRYIYAYDPVTGRPNSVGDALRKAKCDMTESGSTVNKLHYILLGDPSLTFTPAQHTIVVDSINGLATDGNLPQLQAGSRCTMTGHIEDSNGNAITDFNGMLQSRILDTNERITCLNQCNEKEGPYIYNEHRKVLYEGADSVRAGEWRIEFVVPRGINYADTRGRAVFYAQSGDMTANGHTNRYTVGGNSDELDGDTQGPDIRMWLDREGFGNGGYVSAAPMLYATVTDDSGLNFAASGLGHGLEACVDGRADMTFDISSAYTPIDSHSGSVAYQLPALTQGTHSLRLRAWDVLDNHNDTTVLFRVSGLDAERPVQAVLCQSGNQLSINLINTLSGRTCSAMIHLYDATGHLCMTHEADEVEAGGTYTCHLGTNALAGGVYFVQATLMQGVNTYQAETQKTIIAK